MKTHKTKILFFHGLDSSKESTKFHAIDSQEKYCIDVDYRNLNYDTVFAFYKNMINTIKPDLLIGHGVGGYWALKMSLHYHLAAIVANPNLAPKFRPDYLPLQDADLEHDIPQFAYLELGDEVLDMHHTQAVLERFMIVQTYAGGYHRLEHPEHVNLLIQHFENTLCAVKR